LAAIQKSVAIETVLRQEQGLMSIFANAADLP
jgi:hypothetical protein